MSNKTKWIVIHFQKILNQLVEELQELIFMIYFNLEQKFWKMFSQKKLRGNENKAFNTIHLKCQYKQLVHLNKYRLIMNQFHLSKKILSHNLLNQSLINLFSPSPNKFKIFNLIRIFLFSLNLSFNLKYRILNKMFNPYQWFLNLMKQSKIQMYLI